MIYRGLYEKFNQKGGLTTMGDRKMNDLSGKEWLQHSFSIWRGISKTKEEKDYNHPAYIQWSYVRN